MKVLAVAIVLTAFFTPTWAVNKCADEHGKVAYQNEPCARQGEKIKLHNTGSAPAGVALPSARNALSEKIHQSALQVISARVESCGPKIDRIPAVGMSEDDFLCTGAGIHSVRKINRTTTATGVLKQYVIREGGYVYTENGVVTAVQN